MFFVWSAWNKSHKNPHKYVRRSGAEVGSRLCWGLRGKAGLGVQRIKDSFIQKPLRISALNWMQLTEGAAFWLVQGCQLPREGKENRE